MITDKRVIFGFLKRRLQWDLFLPRRKEEKMAITLSRMGWAARAEWSLTLDGNGMPTEVMADRLLRIERGPRISLIRRPAVMSA